MEDSSHHAGQFLPYLPTLIRGDLGELIVCDCELIFIIFVNPDEAFALFFRAEE